MRRWSGAGLALGVAVATGLFVSPRVMGARGNGFTVMGDAIGGVVRGLRGGADEERRSTSQAQEFRWAGVLDEGRSIEIKGVNGPIEAVPARGSEVVVTAEKSSRRSDADEVRIEVVEHEDGVTVCAVYPSDDGRNRCEPGDGGRNSVRNNDTRVSFRVEVPAGVRFHARTVNGDVEALDLEADVEATTVNGDVEVATAGFARATTVNGSIHASMGRWAGTGAAFTTVNGSIELDVPDDVDADVEARWVNGRLETDLPLRLQGSIGRRSASGTFGQGGPELRLETVNGSIRIR
jgi:hypothetical protein